MGTSAHVGPGERASLRREGLSEWEIDQVDAVARRHAGDEDARDWLIGPERAVLVHHLDAAGIAPTDTDIRRLRAGALCLMAELFGRTADLGVFDVAVDGGHQVIDGAEHAAAERSVG